jgi:hypothetical protein
MSTSDEMSMPRIREKGHEGLFEKKAFRGCPITPSPLRERVGVRV